MDKSTFELRRKIMIFCQVFKEAISPVIAAHQVLKSFQVTKALGFPPSLFLFDIFNHVSDFSGLLKGSRMTRHQSTHHCKPNTKKDVGDLYDFRLSCFYFAGTVTRTVAVKCSTLFKRSSMKVIRTVLPAMNCKAWV